jgi:membrane protein DedA with SNARE-associated domain
MARVGADYHAKSSLGHESVLWLSPKSVRMEWLLGLLTSHVYAKLAGILLLCGLGLPIPEDISLISAGYLAHLGTVHVHTVFLVCFVAVLGGDALAFTMGRQFGTKILASRFGHRYFNPRRQRRVRAYFRRYGSKVVFIARFLPGLRFSIFLSAGMLHVRAYVFIVYDSLAALVSVPFLVYSSWYFGDKIDQVIKWAKRSEYGILAIVGVVVLYVVIKLLRKRRVRPATATE